MPAVQVEKVGSNIMANASREQVRGRPMRGRPRPPVGGRGGEAGP